MELEGLKRCISLIGDHGLNFEKLVTDRHMSIGKWIRQDLQDVIHLYDLWHIAKGRPYIYYIIDIIHILISNTRYILSPCCNFYPTCLCRVTKKTGSSCT